MIKLIVNADDFGYSTGINYGIIDAHQNGIITSATMMMNMPGTEQAIQLAKDHPTLGVGVHLVLTCGSPLLKDVPSLVDENGAFHKLSQLLNDRNISCEDVEREWTAQIERFISSGLVPTHFDSHHHVHSIPELLPVVQKLSKKYSVSFRINSDGALPDVPSFSDLFLSDFYGETATDDYFSKLVNRVKDGAVVEVMTHPGFIDTQVLNGSSYNLDRIKELEILKSIQLPDGIELTAGIKAGS